MKNKKMWMKNRIKICNVFSANPQIEIKVFHFYALDKKVIYFLQTIYAHRKALIL